MVECGEKFLIFTFNKQFVMTTFIGDYPCKVDAKGRIMLPSALKRQMKSSVEGKFVIKKDLFEKCLVLFPIEEWERQNKIIRSKINPYKKEHNKFLRGFYKGTAEIILDGNNRFLVPKRLLEIVGIDKEVVLAGQDGKIEIWNKELYNNIVGDEEDFASLAEKIMDGEIDQFDE
ncbi:MAG: division/cell wall cluster transcriptional repressor MraZ [Bacteroidales bacterium]|nr:division/cell wall cluster transcriptional repressor MraZ [Bacteroidales bacterium]